MSNYFQILSGNLLNQKKNTNVCEFKSNSYFCGEF
jgi:hypothetical protein